MTKINSIRVLIQSVLVALTLTLGSIAVAFGMGWIDHSHISILEIIAVFTSFMCTWMCVQQSRWNYPIAVISTSTLAYVFWEANLLASAALNLYLIPTVIYGYFIWGCDDDTRPVRRLEFNTIPHYIFWTALAYLGAYIIVDFFKGELAVLDSWLLIGTIFAQFLLDRKRIETWIIWGAVNIVSIYVYFEAGLYLISLQFALFLLNSVYGYSKWYQTLLDVEDEVVEEV